MQMAAVQRPLVPAGQGRPMHVDLLLWLSCTGFMAVVRHVSGRLMTIADGSEPKSIVLHAKYFE